MNAPKKAAVSTTARIATTPRAPKRPRTRRQTPTFRHHQVNIAGHEIHAYERPARPERKAAAPAIILIHGAGIDHRDWTFDFISRIAPTRRVIAFDRPGFGRSGRSHSASAALPSVQAELLRKTAERLGVRDAVVVGHSWGGAVAMAWGSTAPESTRGVASFSGAVAPWSFRRTLVNGARMRERALTALRAGGRMEALRQSFETAFSPAKPPRGYINHVAPGAESGCVAATLSDLSTINGALALLAPRYVKYAPPVELIYGDRDEILCAQEQGVVASRLLPHARLSILKGRGHMIHHSDVDLCVAAIERLAAAPSAADRAAAFTGAA